MRFKGLDLNLLVTLDVLIEERSVSRAAERLHLSQPSVSAALAKLRDYFNDPLLEIQGKRMVPTAHALQLRPVLAEVLGNVDRMIIQARHFDPVPGIEGGQKLYVRGPNVMRGYLDPTKPFGIDLLPEGWHDTGDVVDVDQDGYIRILGRVKRFAKVGGEMVSLNAVESYAQQVWSQATHAAIAMPDARKGEKIILFTSQADADPGAFVTWCKANGVQDIAVPKKIIHVDDIPVLGTGKTDYVALGRMAADLVARAEAA